jgi:hypothetical protein
MGGNVFPRLSARLDGRGARSPSRAEDLVRVGIHAGRGEGRHGIEACREARRAVVAWRAGLMRQRACVAHPPSPFAMRALRSDDRPGRHSSPPSRGFRPFVHPPRPVPRGCGRQIFPPAAGRREGEVPDASAPPGRPGRHPAPVAPLGACFMQFCPARTVLGSFFHPCMDVETGRTLSRQRHGDAITAHDGRRDPGSPARTLHPRARGRLRR